MNGYILSFMIGLITGAGVVIVWWLARGRNGADHGIWRDLGEIKLRSEDVFRQLQQVTAVFANAGQRGQAGEFTLENLLERTGMVKHVDYDTQVVTPDGARPDVILNLPERGCLVIDAKFPLDEFQRAAAAEAEQEPQRALTAHARAVAGHVSTLAKRDYPSKIKDAINFTVCFVPADDLLAAACKERPELFYDAIRQRVLIATPTTLVALLWGVAYGWQQNARVRQAQQIGDIAAELHKRFGTLLQHLHKLGAR